MVALALLPKGTTQEFVLIVIHQVLNAFGIVGSPDQVASQGWLDVRIRNFTFGHQKYREGLMRLTWRFFV